MLNSHWWWWNIAILDRPRRATSWWSQGPGISSCLWNEPPHSVVGWFNDSTRFFGAGRLCKTKPDLYGFFVSNFLCYVTRYSKYRHIGSHRCMKIVWHHLLWGVHSVHTFHWWNVGNLPDMYQLRSTTNGEKMPGIWLKWSPESKLRSHSILFTKVT